MDGGTFYNNPVDWYRPYESDDRRVLGANIGIPSRRAINNVSDFNWAIFDPMARVVYERIGLAQPTMSDAELRLYRADAWLRTVNFFGGLPPVPPQNFAF